MCAETNTPFPPVVHIHYYIKEDRQLLSSVSPLFHLLSAISSGRLPLRRHCHRRRCCLRG